jgi:Tol biopolymer transport system component
MWQNLPRLFLLVSFLLAAVALPLARDGRAGPSPFPTKGLLAFTCVQCPQDSYEKTIRPDGSGLHRIGGAGGGLRWSPNGRLLAYATDGEIWLRTIDSSANRRLTHPAGNRAVSGDQEPAWFPNGKRLVFVRVPHRSGDSRDALWTVGVDGRGAKLLYSPPPTADFYNTGANVADPDVSHDGRRIAFDDISGHLWVTGPQAVALRPLGPADLNGSNPRWSPDDTRIAYLDLGQELAVLDLRSNTTRMVDFGPTPYQDGDFSWSPDGRWLAVSQEYDYECGDPTGPCQTVQLWIVNATDGTARRIYRTPVGGDITSIDWR